MTSARTLSRVQKDARARARAGSERGARELSWAAAGRTEHANASDSFSFDDLSWSRSALR